MKVFSKISAITGVTLVNMIMSAQAFAALCPEKDQFKSVFNNTCYATYEAWLADAWVWAMAVIIPLSVLILTAAGILYMTSEGDSTRIGTAKKMIIGVFSGLGLLVLARLLLVVILGDPSVGGWQF